MWGHWGQSEEWGRRGPCHAGGCHMSAAPAPVLLPFAVGRERERERERYYIHVQTIQVVAFHILLTFSFLLRFGFAGGLPLYV